MPTDNSSGAFTEKSPLGNLRSPVQESRLKVLFSNLRDFLVERPVKVRGDGQNQVFSSAGFGTGVRENLSEFFKPTPRGPANSGLMTNWNAGFTSVWQNLKDLINPPKRPPMPADGEAVPEIWSKNTQFTRVQALSIAFHVVVLALIIGPLLPALFSPPTTKANNNPLDATDISAYLKMPPAIKKAGGGGGQRDLTPASRGRAPKFATQQIAPPLSHPIEHPQIAMQPTLLGNPALTPPNINASNWGDPLSHVLGDSMGNGKGTGIGNGDGGGLGNGFENGTGGGYPTAGTGGYGTPACLYCPNAQFSDEAVKAKYQGTVLVSAVIGADGRVIEAKVIKSLGLGLDENAVAAVKTWRFKPALGPDGKPTTVRQTIEVVFHLY
jgi:periplasmic protein TonB